MLPFAKGISFCTKALGNKNKKSENVFTSLQTLVENGDIHKLHLNVQIDWEVFILLAESNQILLKNSFFLSHI